MIMQLIINVHELCLVYKRNLTSQLKKNAFIKLVNIRAIYNLVLPCSTSTFFCIKQVIFSSLISMHGSLSIYTYFSSPYK